ncbi:uncharacterized protein LOC127709519 [Mytilus californianus]|uniref:uncharacterized protein LOC127709519 n=1 Tax=Mytilus californianus TaxID=6549 RepID=UPI002245F5E6|nr:uncharacterized protein LOC127709519 [Mytilus californianus]
MWIVNVISVISFTSILSTTTGLRCLTCKDDRRLTDCYWRTPSSCSDGVESCYLEVSVLRTLDTVFNAGCRSVQVCQLLDTLNKDNVNANTASVDKRLSSPYAGTACAQCCSQSTTDHQMPCNTALCNQRPNLRIFFGLIGKRNSKE